MAKCCRAGEGTVIESSRPRRSATDKALFFIPRLTCSISAWSVGCGALAIGRCAWYGADYVIPVLCLAGDHMAVHKRAGAVSWVRWDMFWFEESLGRR